MLAFDVNWLAVLVATLIDMVIGSLWYSPVLFANQWMRALGKKQEELTGARNAMIVAALVAFLSAFILAVVVRSLGADTLVRGALVGLVAWLGFVVPSAALTQVFEGRSTIVNLLFIGYRLVTLVIAGAVLALWQ